MRAVMIECMAKEGWLSGGSCSSLAFVRVPKVSTDPTCQPKRRSGRVGGWRRERRPMMIDRARCWIRRERLRTRSQLQPWMQHRRVMRSLSVAIIEQSSFACSSHLAFQLLHPILYTSRQPTHAPELFCYCYAASCDVMRFQRFMTACDLQTKWRIFVQLEARNNVKTHSVVMQWLFEIRVCGETVRLYGPVCLLSLHEITCQNETQIPM